jgi:hypothetical protein
MRVLERWRAYESDPVFVEIFRDAELVELSDHIFGRIPGTKAVGR